MAHTAIAGESKAILHFSSTFAETKILKNCEKRHQFMYVYILDFNKWMVWIWKKPGWIEFDCMLSAELVIGF